VRIVGSQLLISLAGVVRDPVADIKKQGVADIPYVEVIDWNGNVLSTVSLQRDAAYEAANKSFWRPYAYQSQRFSQEIAVQIAALLSSDDSLESDPEAESSGNVQPSVGQVTFFIRTAPNRTGRRGDTAVTIEIENLERRPNEEPQWAITRIDQYENVIRQTDWNPYAVRVVGDKTFLSTQTATWNGVVHQIEEWDDGYLYLRNSPPEIDYRDDIEDEEEIAVHLGELKVEAPTSWTMEGMMTVFMSKYGNLPDKVNGNRLLMFALSNGYDLRRTDEVIGGANVNHDQKVITISNDFWFGLTKSDEAAARALYAKLKAEFGPTMAGDFMKNAFWNLQGARLATWLEDPDLVEKLERERDSWEIIATQVSNGVKSELTWAAASMIGGQVIGRASKGLKGWSSLRAARGGVSLLKALKITHWREAEQFVLKLYGGKPHKWFKTAHTHRFVDVFTETTKTAREVKRGRVSATDFIKRQVKKDVDLLTDPRHNTNLIEWHFFQSDHGIGPTDELLEFIRDYVRQHGVENQFRLLKWDGQVLQHIPLPP
jgi:hypothetical protein